MGSAKRDINFAGFKAYGVKSIDFSDFSELTIASGAITVTQACHTVDTQDDDPTDDLDTISGGTNGMLLFIRPENDARTVVVKHGTGNIWISGGADVTLDDVRDLIALVYDGTKWSDVGGAGVIASAHARSHLITSTSDHSPTGLTASQLLRLNAAATAIESSGKVVGDFEASGAVSTHAALTTGIHGVGGSTIESASGSQGKVDTHAALTTGIHGVGAGVVAKVGDIATDANLSAAAQAAITASHARSHTLVSTSDHTSAVTVNKHFKADASGLPVEGANTDAEISAAVSASHARSHTVTSTSDHTSTATAGKILKADASGLPVDATNTDTEVADAVTKKHTQSHLITSTSDHSPTGLTASQLLRLNAGATAVESSGKTVTDFIPYYRYLFPKNAVITAGFSTQAGVAGRVFLVAIDVPRAVTIDAVGCIIDTAGGAGTTFRLGVYGSLADIPDGRSLIVDAGTRDATQNYIHELTIADTNLVQGTVFVGIETEDTTIKFCRYSATSAGGVVVNKSWGTYFDRAGGYGPLPTPCPETTYSATARPILFLRVKSVNA